MKKNIKKIVSVLAAIMVVMGAGVAFSEPGSNSDPLVSASYVDKKIEEVKRYIDSKLGGNSSSSPIVEESSSLEVVQLQKGQSLIGKSGTEIILRSGRAVAIGSDLGGVSDVTSGKDINSNMEVGKNHLLIIPRDDGRGVYSKTEAFYMVRGDYRIE